MRLALWQKVLGLLRDIRVARADISDVRVVADPVREAMRAGIKVGLRLPWLLLRRAQHPPGRSLRRAPRRPAPVLRVENGTARCSRVLLSTPDADELAQHLRD